MKFVLALFSALALAVGSANAGTVVGINSVANGGGLYSIDTATGVATLIADTSGAALGSNINSGNSLASNYSTGAYYFSSFSAGTNDKLFTLQGGSISTSGSLVGHVASGTYGGGAYWYFTQAAGTTASELHKVTFSGTSIATDTVVPLTGAVKPWTFGDIVASGTTIYGVGIAPTGPQLFSVDLTTGVVTTIATIDTNLQLAFSGSELIGLSTTTGNIYSVDVTTGALTYLSTVTSSKPLYITDLTSTVVPEPTSLALLGIGLTGFFSFRRRFLSKKSA